VITWESFAFKNDLVLALDVRAVESGHQEVQVRSQGLHDGDFRLVGSNDGCYQLGGSCICIQPCWEGRLLERLEVPLNTLGSPGAEVLLKPGDCPLGLQAERVPAEVDAVFFYGALLHASVRGNGSQE
jgi:hypothetical protein